jgi:hypothetical protein
MNTEVENDKYCLISCSYQVIINGYSRRAHHYTISYTFDHVNGH